MRMLAQITTAALVGFACAASGQKAAESSREDLRFGLEAPATVRAGAAVEIRFTLENLSDRALAVLTWYTPLEGMNGNIFRVTRDGTSIPYRGRMMKRGAPSATDYVTLAARSSVSATVDLASGYDVSVPGAYRIEFVGRLHDVAADPRAVPRAADAQRAAQIAGNAVELRVVPR